MKYLGLRVALEKLNGESAFRASYILVSGLIYELKPLSIFVIRLAL